MVNEDLIQPSGSMLTYGSYLKVGDLLSLQTPVSAPAEHDELLFIIIHQVYELWFKQTLHELDLGILELQRNNLMGLMRTVHRINTIQHVLTQQVDILETMTPTDFNRFRDRLNPASGFQSHQFRLYEFRLGLKERNYLKFFRTQPEIAALLERTLNEPSFYDYLIRFLAGRGYDVPKDILERDVTQPHVLHEGLKKVLLDIYRAPQKHYDIYAALEALLDLDQGLHLWRYRHVAMVERMIGSRRGTGGSTGVQYLTQTLSKRCFPELWALRSDLGESNYGV